jgi:histone H3
VTPQSSVASQTRSSSSSTNRSNSMEVVSTPKQPVSRRKTRSSVVESEEEEEEEEEEESNEEEEEQPEEGDSTEPEVQQENNKKRKRKRSRKRKSGTLKVYRKPTKYANKKFIAGQGMLFVIHSLLMPSILKEKIFMFYSGVGALGEMRYYKSSAAAAMFMISRMLFGRLVREILQEYERTSSEPYRIQAAALEALQSASESYLAAIFEMTNLAAIHARRVTVMPKDFTVTNQIWKGLPGPYPWNSSS